MKRLIKLAVLLLAVTAAFALLVSCSAEDPVPDLELAGDIEYRLNNAEFVFRDYEYYGLADNALFSYPSSTVFYDAALKRLNDLESKYECRITIKNMPDGVLEDTFTPAIMSGVYLCDMLMQGEYWIRPQIEGGLFEDVTAASDIIDYTDSDKWGSPYIIEWMVWNDGIYGLTPMLWPNYYITCFSNIFVFNEAFARKFGQPDPYEYVETGVWSRETLEEMMPTYTYKDSAYEVRSMVCYPGNFVDQALRSNNAQIYKRDKDKLVSGYHTPEGVEALEWARDFLYNDYKKNIWPNIDDLGNWRRMLDGDVALLLAFADYSFGSKSMVSYGVDDYCLLPFPNGPERKDQYYTAMLESVRNTVMFPVTGHDFESAIFICNELFSQLEDYDSEKLGEYYVRYYFRTESEYKMCLELIKTSRYTYIADGFRTVIVDSLSENLSISQFIDARKSQYDYLFDKFVVPTVESMDRLFGEGWDA